MHGQETSDHVVTRRLLVRLRARRCVLGDDAPWFDERRPDEVSADCHNKPPIVHRAQRRASTWWRRWRSMQTEAELDTRQAFKEIDIAQVPDCFTLTELLT